MSDILLVSTKRSGHHAVIHWLAMQMPETVRHYNDMRPGKMVRGIFKHVGGSTGETYEGNDTHTSIYSLEDCPMEWVHKILKALREQGKDLTPIIVIRDLRNTVASIIKSTSRHVLTNRLDQLIYSWRSYVYRYIKKQNEKEFFIFFDKWFQDKAYREQICESLGIPFTDEGLNQLSTYAGGSSFDGKRFQKNAQEMDVLHRYKVFENDPVYHKYCTRELLKINEFIFGEKQ